MLEIHIIKNNILRAREQQAWFQNRIKIKFPSTTYSWTIFLFFCQLQQMRTTHCLCTYYFTRSVVKKMACIVLKFITFQMWLWRAISQILWSNCCFSKFCFLRRSCDCRRSSSVKLCLMCWNACSCQATGSFACGHVQ